MSRTYYDRTGMTKSTYTAIMKEPFELSSLKGHYVTHVEITGPPIKRRFGSTYKIYEVLGQQSIALHIDRRGEQSIVLSAPGTAEKIERRELRRLFDRTTFAAWEKGEELELSESAIEHMLPFLRISRPIKTKR